MEWIVFTIVCVPIFAWVAYRWRIRKQDERREFRTGEPQRMAAEISKRLGAVRERKPHFIRMNGAKPFTKFSLTPKEYGEYLLRRGVKKWGRK